MVKIYSFSEVLASELGFFVVFFYLFKKLCPSGIYMVVKTDRTVLMCSMRKNKIRV